MTPVELRNILNDFLEKKPTATRHIRFMPEKKQSILKIRCLIDWDEEIINLYDSTYEEDREEAIANGTWKYTTSRYIARLKRREYRLKRKKELQEKYYKENAEFFNKNLNKNGTL